MSDSHITPVPPIAQSPSGQTEGSVDFMEMNPPLENKPTERTPTDIDTIKTCCVTWARENFGEDFQFRQYQLENIVFILNNILNGKVKTNTLEAPTGSGKSIIAMVICGVAYKYYRMNSYILVSDIGLLEQYVRDFNKYELNWGHLKGQGNYDCMMNGMQFRNGECQLAHVSYGTLMNADMAMQEGFSCALSCECILHRKRAISSPITLMTYQLYLNHMNRVVPMMEERGGDPPFTQRDIVICDECHLLPTIVQNFASPEIRDADQQHYSNIIRAMNDRFILISDDITFENLFNVQRQIFTSPDNVTAYEHIKRYRAIIDILQSYSDELKKSFAKKKSKLNKNDRSLLFHLDWLSSQSAMIDAFCTIVDILGPNTIVRNGEKADEYKLDCIYGDYMTANFFHAKTNYEVLLSATVCDADMYKKEIGAALYKDQNMYSFVRIPSTFDFTRSPIYIVPSIRMSYQEKEKNFPTVLKLIELICHNHSGQRGIIHTGNYTFAQRVAQGASPVLQHRLLVYSSAKNKQEYLENYRLTTDGILVGPTLTEGIDLPNDECRFMIIMKCPYSLLTDKLVVAKMNLIPRWYQADAMKRIVQSLGRGIRHKDDWCVTYVLDGCVMDVIVQEQHFISPELIERIRVMNP